MAQPDQKFSLRLMQPSDSAAIAALITGFEGSMTTQFLVDPYAAIIQGTEDRTLGVVVECAGVDGFVGMGTVRFSQVQFNGEVLPLAFLDGLKVHNDFRRQGLGYRIADWRIQQAREAYGDRCVIATGMLHDNHASKAVAKKWCREFVDPAYEVLILPVRSQPPKPLAGIAVREIEPREYEEFATKQNKFDQHYILYPPGEASTIANALAISVEERKPYRFVAAVDAGGNLLAGAKTWARGLLKSDTLNNPPTPLRVMNNILHFLPQDFKIRDLAVQGLWYEPGRFQVGQFLWEMIRWIGKDQANTIVATFDSRDPARQTITLKPWHQPRPKITIAIQAPMPVDRQNYLFALGRV